MTASSATVRVTALNAIPIQRSAAVSALAVRLARRVIARFMVLTRLWCQIFRPRGVHPGVAGATVSVGVRGLCLGIGRRLCAVPSWFFALAHVPFWENRYPLFQQHALVSQRQLWGTV